MKLLRHRIRHALLSDPCCPNSFPNFVFPYTVYSSPFNTISSNLILDDQTALENTYFP